MREGVRPRASIEGAAERGRPRERTERARGRCRFAVDPCHAALRYLCGRGHAGTPGLPHRQ